MTMIMILMACNEEQEKNEKWIGKVTTTMTTTAMSVAVQLYLKLGASP